MLFPLPVHPTYHIVLEDLATVGLHESVMRMIRTSRFENLVNVEEPVFHELFVEFLSSFIFHGSTPVDYNRKNEVLFQLGGKKFYFSLNEFAIHCEFYPKLSVTAGDFDRSPYDLKHVRHHQFWREIIHADAAQKNYDPRLCKSTNIGHSELRFLHRLITGTICGRRESTGCVSLRDLFYLQCFDQGLVPHLGHGFAHYMEGMSRKKKGALCGGSYVTRLAKNLGVFDTLTNLRQLCSPLPFNITVMKKIRVVTFRDGRYVLITNPSDLGPAELLPRPQQHHTDVPPPPPPSSTTGPSSSSYPSHIDTTLQYHTDLMHWMAEGLSHLCRIQGVPLPPRPVFPGSTSTAVPAAPDDEEVDPDAVADDLDDPMAD